jgi:hypothetical protein
MHVSDELFKINIIIIATKDEKITTTLTYLFLTYLNLVIYGMVG